MTSFCASTRFLWIGPAVALAAAAAVSGAAQEPPTAPPGAPVALDPPKVLVPGQKPLRPVAPPRPSPKAQVPPKPAPESGIKVDTLAVIDPNSAGVLDSGSGGLGIEMWAGTGASVAHRLLEGQGRQPTLPAARGLLRRLLLTAARPPKAAAAAGSAAPPKGGKGPTLIARRVERLLAMGEVEAAHALLEVVPPRVEEESIARARMNTAFLMNDNAGACREARTRAHSFRREPWRKAFVFCQHLEGEGPRAAIGVGLLREQGVEDKAFFALMGIMAGHKDASFAPPSNVTPLHLAMMRAARVPIPEIMVETGGAATLRTIAYSPNASLDVRLDAAERAAALGSLKPGELRKLYGAVNFPPGDVSQALSAADSESGPRGRALLYQAARAQQVPAARAEILAKVLVLARAQGRMATAIRAFHPLLSSVPPRDDLDWFAALAGRALFFAGDYDKAVAWSVLARGKPHSETRPRSSEPAAAVSAGGLPGAVASVAVPSDVALWPLTALAMGSLPEPSRGAAGPGGVVRAESKAVVKLVTQGKAAIESVPLTPVERQSESDFDAAMFARWHKVQVAMDPVAAARRAALLLTLIDALGRDVPQEAWLDSTGPVRDAVALPAHGFIAALGQAARAGRVAEGVLLAMVVLGNAGENSLHPAVIGAAVRGLVTLGFEREARALAVEAAFSAGL